MALQGRLDTGYYQRSGEVNERYSYLFEVVLKQDGRWQMRVKNAERRDRGAASRFDGEAVYRIEHRTPSAIPADSAGSDAVD